MNVNSLESSWPAIRVQLAADPPHSGLVTDGLLKRAHRAVGTVLEGESLPARGCTSTEGLVTAVAVVENDTAGDKTHSTQTPLVKYIIIGLNYQKHVQR